MRFLTIGLGHCGGKIANDFKRVALEQKGLIVETCAINTDRADLATHRYIPESHKLIIGTGKGAARNWKEGAEAATQARTNIRELINRLLTPDTDIILITAGEGGGSGSGIAPTVAEVIAELGKTCTAILTLPFENESVKAKVNAAMGLDLLYRQEALKALICIDNDKITAHFPEKIITEAYERANRAAVGTFTNLLKLAKTPSLADRIDESELTIIFDYPGFATLANHKTKANLVTDLAATLRHSWNSSLLAEVDPKTAAGAIFGVQGPENLFTTTHVDAVRRTFSEELVGKDIMLGVYPVKQTRWTSYVGILAGMNVPKKVEKLLEMAKQETEIHETILEERKKMKKEGLGFKLNAERVKPPATTPPVTPPTAPEDVRTWMKRHTNEYKAYVGSAFKYIQTLSGQTYALNELINAIKGHLDLDDEAIILSIIEALVAEGFIVEKKKNVFLVL